MYRSGYLALVLLLALPLSARADICGDYRGAIDAYMAAADARAVVEEALEAAKSGASAGLASRRAVKALRNVETLRILEGAGAAGALDAADAASTATSEAFEAIYNKVKEAAAAFAGANAAVLEEARVEADEAAVVVLDSLSKFKAVTRKTALKAASAAARASPGATTWRALIATHENIFKAACG